ncbi:hypothetical protein PROFUN_16405 [Planoprotostelium fungivorum]|uniref:Uncharacterized protein n=1 Tax=Planoprotostelium fungivorum TaxID=1890364 RepID=A0A2P6MPP5_9EUKA|nr:hypothetical protein PROFUN_16405 [Planoprotostelium fungivorum]
MTKTSNQQQKQEKSFQVTRVLRLISLSPSELTGSNTIIGQRHLQFFHTNSAARDKSYNTMDSCEVSHHSISIAHDCLPYKFGMGLWVFNQSLGGTLTLLAAVDSL